MSKELEDALRIFALIAVFLLIMAVAIGRIRRLEDQIEKLKNAPADTVTVVKTDTLIFEKPVVQYRYIKEKELVEISDTTYIHDTVTHLIQLPREYMVYKDSSYRAVVSGVQPRLDSMEIYQKTVTNTITKTITEKKKPHFSISIGPGISWDGKKVKPALQATAGFVIKSW